MGTGDRDSCAIVNAPLNCTSVGWLSVRGHHCHYFSVQPGSSCYLPILHGDGVASVTKGENILLLMCINYKNTTAHVAYYNTVAVCVCTIIWHTKILCVYLCVCICVCAYVVDISLTIY